tara:strand:- start:69489 stop:70334 length:846 start_codon:yes stop_codon:yes gene_type:complete
MQAGPYTLELKNNTLLMGVLNLTPDSFHDGGRYTSIEAALAQAKKMEAEGADIIDVGPESTREVLGQRTATSIEASTEIQRLLPVLDVLLKECRLPISIDTYKSSVAALALEAGAHMINDVWGFQRDPDMARVVAEHNVPVTLMHNQVGTDYTQDVVHTVIDFLKRSIDIALKAGVAEDKIILDPGSGFGKNVEQSSAVLARLGELKALGFPVLIGTSRKSMIGKILGGVPSEERLYGTIATTALAVSNGANILRVHDIKENKDAVKVTQTILQHTTPVLS